MEQSSRWTPLLVVLLFTNPHTAKHYRETFCRVSPKSLQSAWKWCSKMQCCGSTNILDALKFALSVDGVQGIYLLTDGNADMVSTLCIWGPGYLLAD